MKGQSRASLRRTGIATVVVVALAIFVHLGGRLIWNTFLYTRAKDPTSWQKSWWEFYPRSFEEGFMAHLTFIAMIVGSVLIAFMVYGIRSFFQPERNSGSTAMTGLEQKPANLSPKGAPEPATSDTQTDPDDSNGTSRWAPPE